MSAVAHRVLLHRTLTIGSFLRKAAGSIAKVFVRAFARMSEANVQKAQIEAELYRNRYKHASKNDDDLPVVR
jgi:hypothetical protein